MKSRLTIIIAIITLAAPAWAQPTSITLDNLNWMSGRWTSSGQEEYWSQPKAKSMFGYHRDMKDESVVFFEFLRLEENDEGITYWASPMGKTWTPFRLKKSAPNTVLFSNPKHDFPRTIRYTRAGDVLKVEISDGASKIVRWEWSRQNPKS